MQWLLGHLENHAIIVTIYFGEILQEIYLLFLIFPIPSLPGNKQFTFCFHGYVWSGNFIHVEF